MKWRRPRTVITTEEKAKTCWTGLRRTGAY